jgi:hypothetical protein
MGFWNFVKSGGWGLRTGGGCEIHDLCVEARVNAYVISLILAVIGGAVMVYGSRFPEYSDPNANALLNDASWFTMTNKNVDSEVVEEYGDDAVAAVWIAHKRALETARNACFDLGGGIIALGIGSALLFAVNGVRKWRDLRRLSGPKTSGRFYLFAALTWLSFIPAEWCYYIYTEARGDYPPFADSIAIPMGMRFVFGVLGLPMVLFGVWIAINGTRLPAAIWSGSLFGRINLISAGIWIALILAMLVLTMGVTTRPPIVLSSLFTIYLLLSGRAAAEQPTN